jgi:hypothetical protein
MPGADEDVVIGDDLAVSAETSRVIVAGASRSM